MKAAQELDGDKLQNFAFKIVGDCGAAFSVGLAHIGEQVGLFHAMAEKGPMTSSELAAATGCYERYVREWLAHMAAAEYIEYEVGSGRFTLPAEHAVVLCDTEHPFFLPGMLQVTTAMLQSTPRIESAFKSGECVGWGEHHHKLFGGTERLFRPGYVHNLVQSWLPALDGAVEKLERGTRVADVGCGHGASTRIMAQAYPKSRFFGFDYHAPSINRAADAASEAGVGGQCQFETHSATQYPGQDYDLITLFDCFHDLPDPAGAARHARQAISDDGVVMVVEPMAAEELEGNLNLLGRLFYGASAMCCTPNGVCGGGPGLGAQATEASIRQLFTEAGFTRFRRATETPFNRVFEARA